MRPGSGSQYGRVLAWVGKDNGVLAKAECYAPNGSMASFFRLVSPRRLSDGTWCFGKIRIERMKDGKVKEPRTYLEITGEEQAGMKSFSPGG